MKKLQLIALVVSVTIAILFVRMSYTNQKTSDSVQETQRLNPFFSEFSDCEGWNAKFRVGAEADLYGFHIKALTTAYFDENKYYPHTVYIIKHRSGKSLVINANDAPLLSHSEFARFYENNWEKNGADMIISPSFFDKFCVEGTGKVNVESFQDLPFLFMDVSFKGYPSLLVRK